MLDARLQHAIAVARTGSFTGAAETIGITQSAVTKSVADLEREVGFSIFHRTPRGALLTEDGRDFVERAGRLLEDANELLRGGASRNEPYVGILRIGVCPASLEWLLTQPLVSLLSRHPDIRFAVIGGTFERMVQQLRNNVVDVAFGFDAAFSEWPDLKRTPIGPLKTTLFVRKGHPLLAQSTVTLADLAGHEFISPSDSRPYGSIIRNLYESQGIDWRKKIHIIDSFPVAKSMVAASNAIGSVALTYAASRKFKERFVTLDCFRQFPPASMCCAIRSHWEPTPAVKAFIKVAGERIP